MSRDDWRNREADLDHLEKHLGLECRKRGITRRDLMKGGMAMASALGLGALFAACGGTDEPSPAATPPPPPHRPRPRRLPRGHRPRRPHRPQSSSPASCASSAWVST